MKFISFLAAASILAGCATSPSSEVPTVTSVTVKLLSSSVSAGKETTVTAEAALSNGTTSDVTTQAAWTSSNTAVALLACTQTPCPVTAVSAGSAKLTAAFGGKSGSATFTASAATLSSIAVTASALGVPAGKSVACAVSGTMSDGTTQDVTSQAAWSSSTAAVATVSLSGIVTGLTAGMSTITATVNNLTATITVTVTAPVPVSLALSPNPAIVAMGVTLQLAATATMSDGTTEDATASATWVSSDSTAAIVSTGGLVLPQAPGMANVTATVGALTASEMVTVTPAQVTSILVTPSPASIPIGLTQQLAATATLTDTTMEVVTSTASWSSSNSSIATVSSGGLVTAVARGSTTVTATLGAVVATVSVVVGPPVPVSITITAADTTIPEGSSEQLTATATLSDGSMANVTSASTWTNAPAGKVTGAAEGTITVTATDGLAMGMITITVGPAVPSTITVTAPQTTIPAELIVQLDASSLFTNEMTFDVTSTATWSSSDTMGTIASVNATTGALTTLGPGMATITASQDGVMGTLQIVVVASISSVAVTPTSATLTAGQTVQLAVKATLSDSTTQTVTSLATWSTDDPSGNIATVSASGLVTGVAANATVVNVTAEVGGDTNTAQITVN